MGMVDRDVEILENQKINGKYYKLSFRSRELAEGVKPGQFLNLQLARTYDPFLRRPFSYYRVKGDLVEVLYEVLGRGTAMLSKATPGDRLQATGPLGRPFTPDVPGKKKLLVAGGVGVPPLVFLAERHMVSYLLIGTKSQEEILPPSEIGSLNAQVLYATNDGSVGYKGYVTGLLEEIFKKENPKDLFVQTCGPNPMMRAVMKAAKAAGAEGEASVDKTMACGVGVCLGCMVKVKDRGWVPSCTEGPVFSFHDLEHQIR